MRSFQVVLLAVLGTCCVVTPADADARDRIAAKAHRGAARRKKPRSASAKTTTARPAAADAPAAAEPAKAEAPAPAPGALLPVDCTVTPTDSRCGRPHNAGMVGAGPRINGTSGFPHLGDGFIENNRLVAAVEMGGQIDDQGAIFAFDLTTGDRTILSGKIEDPAKGPILVGTGPDLGNVRAVASAGATWLALVSKGSTDASIVRIDPRTGNRTLEMRSSQPVCAGSTAKLSVNTLGGLAAAPDGTAYVAVGTAARAVGIVAIKGTSCSVVTMSGASGFEAKGTGPTIESLDSYTSLRYEAGKIWALHGMTNSLLTIDIATGNRVRVSSGESTTRVGSGDAKLGSSHLAIAGSHVWTTGAWASSRDLVLTDVAVASGARTAHTAKTGPAYRDGASGVWVHPTKAVLVLAIDNGIALYDPATGGSALLSN